MERKEVNDDCCLVAWENVARPIIDLGGLEVLGSPIYKLWTGWGVFSSRQKILHLIHQMFGDMHGVLNIDKK
jgi:hypothetical protein